ncbi:MAG: ice-binding family protein [Candidatus Bathyarchaeia archaeon]|jgi:hypothetical protein
MARSQKIVNNRRVVGNKKGSGRILVSALLLLAIFAIAASNMAVKGVSAATAPSLGTASSFAILAGTPAITDVPTSHIIGDVGLQPAAGSAIGLTCGEVTGTIYSNDGTGPVPCQVTNLALLVTAKNDLTHAYNDAAGRTPTATLVGDNQLGGQTLGPGVYAFGHAATANLVGTLTLDAQGDPSAVFIFQASSDLVTASSSVVRLINGASACNVFWQVTSSATLGTSSTFVGTIMAYASITLTTGVTLNGRALAQTGEVTLDRNTVSQPCSIVTVTTTTTVIGGTTYTVTYTLFGGITLPTVGPAVIPEYPWGVLLLLIPMLLVYMMLKRRNPSH